MHIEMQVLCLFIMTCLAIPGTSSNTEAHTPQNLHTIVGAENHVIIALN